MENVLKNRRGESSIVATVLLMALTLFTMSLTLSYVQQNLTRRSGESEFTLAKTYMKNIGLSVDDVAWHTGQMNTLQYSSQNAQIHLREGLIHYKLEVTKDGINYNEINETKDTYLSALIYDIPTNQYSLDNTYFEELLPTNMTELIQSGTSSPIVRVFAVQTPPRIDEESYISIAMVPLIRSVPFNITYGTGTSVTTSNYLKLFLVNVTQGALTTVNPRYITLTGGDVLTTLIPNVRSVRITVIFPKASKGYTSAFFNFPETPQVIDFGSQAAEVELYLGTVQVGFLK
jgi:flagellin-like protein